MVERNIPLLEGTLQYVKDHPEKHDQGQWFCGTGGCFAGTAWLLSGHLPLWTATKWDEGEVPPAVFVLFRRGVMAMLGITPEEAGVLFLGNNTRPMLELMVKDLVNGQPLDGQYEYIAQAHGDDNAHYTALAQEALKVR